MYIILISKIISNSHRSLHLLATIEQKMHTQSIKNTIIDTKFFEMKKVHVTSLLRVSGMHHYD